MPRTWSDSSSRVFSKGRFKFGIIPGKTVMAEKQQSGESSAGNGNAALGVGQATEAVEKLRLVVDQASRSIKDLTQASQQWAHDAQEQARGVANQLREQGNRAVGTVSETVEQNPLTSLAVAFALGFLAASLIIRRGD
jgi:ElaB/YqjD/DUF883 family membrane-anchored ribosome-binding protein